MIRNAARGTVLALLAAAVGTLLLRFKRTSTTTQLQLLPTAAAAMTTHHRILCYGDSLTAGTSGADMFPYAPILETLLIERNSNNKNRNIQVRHKGLPGWTVGRMVEELKTGASTSLTSAIRGVQNPSLSLVILLAGTNDLGYESQADIIFDNLMRLHEAAWSAGVPRTIAIAIPPSGYQSQVAAAKELAVSINSMLEQACKTNNHRMTYVKFPFPFETRGRTWYSDTLHFSQEGYSALAHSLAPVVDQVLNEMDASNT
jgi:lysophospholipase L1-like esterase